MLFLFAGTFKEASEFARKHNLFEEEYRIIYKPEKLFGLDLNKDSAIVTIGSYYNSNCTNMIHDIAVRHDLRIIRSIDFNITKLRASL